MIVAVIRTPSGYSIIYVALQYNSLIFSAALFFLWATNGLAPPSPLVLDHRQNISSIFATMVCPLLR
jgi:hypothetical protein